MKVGQRCIQSHQNKNNEGRDSKQWLHGKQWLHDSKQWLPTTGPTPT